MIFRGLNHTDTEEIQRTSNMESLHDCISKYSLSTDVPLHLCQECKLRKLPDTDNGKCDCGNGRLKNAGYDL